MLHVKPILPLFLVLVQYNDVKFKWPCPFQQSNTMKWHLGAKRPEQAGMTASLISVLNGMDKGLYSTTLKITQAL